MSEYKICLSSPPDRDKLVAEVFFENQQWIEINQENDTFEIEFYPRQDGNIWKISYSDAINAMQEAKLKLLES